MSGRAHRIEVVIDELVLHGFDPRHREQIADALRAELAAALEGLNVAAGSGAAGLDAGAFTVPAAASPAVVGRGAGRLVGQVLHRSGQSGPRGAHDGPGGGRGEAEPRRAGTPRGSS